METTPKPEKTLPKPVQPEDWECCGSECGDACIHEIYRREKTEYDEQQKTLNKTQTFGF